MFKKQNKKSVSTLLIISIFTLMSATFFYSTDFSKPETAKALYGEGGNLNGLPINPSNTSSSQIKTDVDPEGNVYSTYRKDLGSGCYGIYFRRYNSVGAVVDSSEVAVENSCSPAHDRSNPDIAVDAYGNFFITWLDNTDSRIYLKGYGPDIVNTYGATQTVDDNSTLPGIPSIATIKSNLIDAGPDQRLLITWAADDGATGYNVYMQAYSYDGMPPAGPTLTELTGGNVMVHNNNSGNDFDQNYPEAAIGTNYMYVTWSGAEDSAASPTILNAVWVRMIVLDTGIPIGTRYLVSDSSYAVSKPTIAASSRDSTDTSPNIKDELFIAWQGQGPGDTDGIFMRKINCPLISGNIICDRTESSNSANMEIRVNTTTTGLQEKPTISIYNSSVDSTRTSGNEDTSIEYLNLSWLTPDPNSSNKIIAGQNFKNNLNRKGTNYTTNTPVTATDTLNNAMDRDGDYVIAYHNSSSNQVELQRYQSVLYAKNPQESITPPDTINAQDLPDIAIGPNGNYVTTFADFTGSSGPNIVYALYDKFGNPIKTLAVANSYTTGIQLNPSVDFYKDTDPTATGYGRFVITWKGEGPGDSNGVFFREFNSDGTPVAVESIAHTATGSDEETLPHISAGLYKQFVIGYIRDTGSETSARYYYRDNATGYEGQINTTTGTTISNVKVQISPAANNSSQTDSKFAVIWRSDSQLRKREGYLSGASVLFNGNDTVVTATANAADISGAKVTGYDFYYVVGYAVSGKIYASSFNHGVGSLQTGLLIRENISLASFPISDEALGTVRVSTDPSTANTLFAYERQHTPDYHMLDPAPSVDTVEIEGKFYRFNTGNLSPFGTQFTISNALIPASIVTMGDIYYTASASEDSDKMATFSYVIDDENIYVVTIEDPFNLGSSPLLQPVASQEVAAGGKLITVPSSLDFGSIPKSGTGTINISTDATPGYVEISDLDGNPFSLTVNMTDMVHSTMPAEIINKSNFEIKNNDGSNTGGPNPGVTAQNAYTDVSDLTLDPSTNSYVNLSSDRTLAAKTGTATGIWRIYPSFKLTIPALAENGIYNGTLTFTLI